MGSRTYLPRVFVDTPLAVGASLELDDDKRHHLSAVLRLGEGAQVILFNGDGSEYGAQIHRASRKAMALTVDTVHAAVREPPLDLTLVQGIARGDRMDFALAKAVELGVTRICPVFTARGQVKLAGPRLEKKQTHWRKVMESAAEQSGRLICPRIEAAGDLGDLLAATPADADTRRLMLAPGAQQALGDCRAATRVALLVGPESGLAAHEIETAAHSGWIPLSLGPRVLRTETAGMAALAAIQTRWGDMG